jgi:5-methylcytosine-specific restriction endonuclease McrA
MPRLPPHRCQYPHCPRLIHGPAVLCGEHRKPKHPRQQRGYDQAYDVARRQLISGATVCEVCGRSFTAEDPPQVDHIDPRGGTAPSNLRVVHRSFNIRRRNMPQPYCTGTRKPMPGEAKPFHPTPSRRRPPDVWIG